MMKQTTLNERGARGWLRSAAALKGVRCKPLYFTVFYAFLHIFTSKKIKPRTNKKQPYETRHKKESTTGEWRVPSNAHPERKFLLNKIRLQGLNSLQISLVQAIWLE
jgi:hypothetical protein